MKVKFYKIFIVMLMMLFSAVFTENVFAQQPIQSLTTPPSPTELPSSPPPPVSQATAPSPNTSVAGPPSSSTVGNSIVNVTPPNPEEIAKFENWLKNSGAVQTPGKAITSPPPAAPFTNISPPPLTSPPPPPFRKRYASRPRLPCYAGPPPCIMPCPCRPSLAYNSTPTVISKPLTLKQSQAAMLKSTPPAPPPSPESAAAFSLMMQQNMPLTPQQVLRLRQLIDISQRAAAVPANIPPKPVSSTLLINLAPGSTPPAIRLAQGYVTSLVFVDSTGAPWPIAGFEIGDPKANTIQWDGKSNVMMLQAIAPYADGNLVVRLMGLVTPITLELVSGQRVVDYRADIHVSGIGPNAKDVPLGTGLPPSANQLLLDVLDGVAPPGSRLLTVRGGDCLGWLVGDTMFLRTRMTVLSPGWVGRMVSPDGMIAYQLPKTSSVLVSHYGKPVELEVEGF